MDPRGLWSKIFIPTHQLTNSEFKKYHQNEPRFNGVYSRDNLPNKIKDGAYAKKFEKYSDSGTYWVAFYAPNNKVTFLTVLELKKFQKKLRNLLINL